MRRETTAHGWKMSAADRAEIDAILARRRCLPVLPARRRWLKDQGVPAAMPKITYIEHGGREHRVEVPVGSSVMRGAVDNSVPGIDADCGGECACATCHVYVDASWLDAIGTPVPGSQEASMLSFAALARPDSRLSCQITVNEQLDGLVVRLPEGQH